MSTRKVIPSTRKVIPSTRNVVPSTRKVVPANKRLSVEARREQLLAFGRSFFATHGYDALSVDELAARAGVSKALVYHYFGDKRGFYLATIEAVATELEAALAPPEGEPFDVAVRASLTAFVAFVEQSSAIYRTLLRGGIGHDPEASATLDRIRETGARHIYRQLGIEPPSPRLRIAVAGWIAFTESASLEWLDQRALDTEGLDAEALVEILVDALAAVLPAGALGSPATHRERASARDRKASRSER